MAAIGKILANAAYERAAAFFTWAEYRPKQIVTFVGMNSHDDVIVGRTVQSIVPITCGNCEA
jgi:hypothetical protein